MAGYLSMMKMKRKDLEDVNDDFSDFSLSSPARKIRRLDAELPPIMEEEEPEMPVDFEQSLQLGGDTLIEELPCDHPVPVNEERAIVLFKPVNTPPLIHSPSSFSVSSDIISGFKNQLWSSHSGRIKSVDDNDDEGTQKKKCLAVIPWVPSQVVGQEVSQQEVPEVMDAEDVGEAMEIEDSNLSIEQGQVNEFSGMVGNEGLHQWQQQHCMTPRPPQNLSTPIVLYR